MHLLQVDAEIKVRRTTYEGCNQVTKATIDGGKATIVLPQMDAMLESPALNTATHVIVVDRSDDVYVVGGEDRAETKKQGEDVTVHPGLSWGLHVH